jgi:hypothetical protein
MTRHRLVVLTALSILACCGLSPCVWFAVLESSAVLHGISQAFGYDGHAQTNSFSPGLSGSIFGLPVRNIGRDDLALLASNITPKKSFDVILRGEIDKLVLQDLKLTYRIGKDRTGAPDLSFLERLAKVRLLEVQNAEVLVTFEGGPQQVTLTNVNVAVRDYSSRAGGNIDFHADFAFVDGGDTAIAASGKARGNFRLTGVYPGPSGEATVELVVDSARYTSGNRTASLNGLTLAADLAYDQLTETVAINALRGESKDVGNIKGTAKALLRGEMPWSASLSATSVDFAKVLAVIQPFLPADYRSWTIQGQGGIETQAQGTLGEDRPELNGTAAFSFVQGGFSSPNGTTAAQGVNGKLAVEFMRVAPEQKLAFNLRAEQRDGEYLWGKYYNNLVGRQASLTMDGAFFLGGGQRFELRGWLDFFQTGDYSFTAGGEGSDWALHFKAADVSHARVIETLLKEYLKGLSPSLASLSVTGTSFFDTTIRHEGDALIISGTYRTDDASLTAPDMQVSIQKIAADVPFTLEYPSSGTAVTPSQEPGFIRFQTLQRRRLTVESLKVPLVISQNRLEVPEPIAVPFFGGQVHLYGLQIDDVLFPTRYRFGVRIANVDLGRMTRRLTGIEYPGTINADLGMMRYENNRITSEGNALVTLFGGEIEATDLFGENLASVSRKIGGDITFRNISLDELTRKIAVGKITGVIQGSLKNFVMEYGEPASFVLVVESVPRRGVEQSISMDAIQSISILGTGVDSALNRGITQFFKEYPYSKIGLRCVLKNDQFSVNGTIHDGGKEYLVRRGWLRGVDVINQNPNNVISFRDMEERVKRISRSPEIEPGGIKVE